MKSYINEIWKAKTFLLVTTFFILIGAVILLSFDKVEIHLAINEVNSGFLDFFFTYWTYLGDGVFAPIVILVLGILFFKQRKLSTFTLGFGILILAGVLSQTLKRAFFSDALRPSGIIGSENLYLVPGIDVHTYHSFPSGHTTAGFAFMAFIALFFFAKNKFMQFILAITAVLIGYSRMYLSQHFLEDVVVGGILGIISFLLAFGIKHLVTRR